MDNISVSTRIVDDPFALASLHFGVGAPRDLSARPGEIDLEDGTWARAATCGDPGPDPLPDPETPDDF